MTDWKALCEELAEYLALLDEPPHELVCRAQEALAQPEPEADGPAVPEGREPASVVGEPSDEELRKIWETGHLPTDEDLANDDGGQDLQFLFTSAYYRWLEENPEAMAEHESKCIRAVFNAGRRYGHQPAPPAAVEQHHPTPVPVSERLPGVEERDPDECCWWFHPETDYTLPVWVLGFGDDEWEIEKPSSPTHWLPATALPLPQGEVQ